MSRASQTNSPRGGPRSQQPEWLTPLGRSIHGPTPPGGATPCERISALDTHEVREVVELIAKARVGRTSAVLPPRLRTRHWASVEGVVLALDERLGWDGYGWKVGAASAEIRRAEGLPSPSPGRIYSRGVAQSPAVLGSELFINYRQCECEFAFELGLDYPARSRPWSEADARAGIASLLPVIEIGDCVFEDWYGASAYFGTSLDNGGGAAFVEGKRCAEWSDINLKVAPMHVYLDGYYVKSGVGAAAMGDPVTSLTWLMNWLREHGRGLAAGELVSTGTCTGHLFTQPGDTVRADFEELGIVEVSFL